MLRSLSTAVTGMRNHQTKLDVVGNNIANVNTVSYKYNVARFQDSFSQTLKGATAPYANRGGLNPMQVGLGMGISAIGTVHEQGAITSTDQETNLAVEGSGFFVVNDGVNQYYTRDGSFNLDSTGIMVNTNGFKLMGWQGQVADVSKPLEELNIPVGEELVAQATANMIFTGNLDAAATVLVPAAPNYIYPTYAYDSLGNRHSLTAEFTKTATANQWTYEVKDSAGATVSTGGTLEFDSDGILDLSAASATVIVPITLTLATGAASPQTIAPDFSAITQLASHSNAFVKEQDGYEAGELATFSIESTGIIVGSYTNGLVRQIGQVALVNFTNPEGLLKMGSNIYNFTPNSGSARIGLPGLDGRGEIRSRSLEMSNVDLVNEFTELITSSRGFQASSRVISTSDEVLMELINIKR